MGDGGESDDRDPIAPPRTNCSTGVKGLNGILCSGFRQGEAHAPQYFLKPNGDISTTKKRAPQEFILRSKSFIIPPVNLTGGTSFSSEVPLFRALMLLAARVFGAARSALWTAKCYTKEKLGSTYPNALAFGFGRILVVAKRKERNQVAGTRTLSERASRMLSSMESFDIEFKRSVNALEMVDLVAFANSPTGGTILLGVEETQVNGLQRGKVVGCAVDDVERNKIINKAASCIPPVKVDVFIETKDGLDFFRVEVPSGVNKPYCTAGGMYKIRGDGQNLTLGPNSLLNILLVREGNQFVSKYQDATVDLIDQIDGVGNDLESSISRMVDAVEKKLHSSTELLDYLQARDAPERTSERRESAATRVAGIESMLQRLDVRVKAMLDHFSIEDPVSGQDERE